MLPCHLCTTYEVLPTETDTNSMAHWYTIVPIPKACTKNPLDLSQYRGITVLSVVYKALCNY